MVRHMQLRAPPTSNPLSQNHIVVQPFSSVAGKTSPDATILLRALRFCYSPEPLYRLKLV